MRDFITYYNIVFKNYLKLSYTKLNSPARSGEYLTTIARANITNNTINKIKKENHSTTLDTLIFNSSLTLSTVHSILSPISTSIILTIVAGSVVLTELLDVAPLLNFVFCLNINTITSIMFLFIIIFIRNVIYTFLTITITITITFIYYKRLSYIRGIFSEAATSGNICLLKSNERFK